jgi:hypothetical protein
MIVIYCYIQGSGRVEKIPCKACKTSLQLLDAMKLRVSMKDDENEIVFDEYISKTMKK